MILRFGVDLEMALRAYLRGAHTEKAATNSLESLISAGLVVPPRRVYSVPTARVSLPDGVTTLDMLDRVDRFA